jgi:thioredoxin reductase (NADPH)
MLKLDSVLIDALPDIGGQCAALYPEKPIYDIPAHPGIEAAMLIEQLERQIAPFAPRRFLNQRVEQLSGASGDFTLVTGTGQVIHAGAVIIAAGAGAFGPNRPPLDGLEAFETTGSVQYYVKRREEFRGKRVVIAGGGDSAVDWALSLSELAAKVMVVHRRAKFRAAPESCSRLDQLAAEGRIDMVIPYQLKALRGEAGRLETVVVETLEGEEKDLAADCLLPFAEWGLALERHHIPVQFATCETSIPGVFAIGDVATYQGKLKLILQGFSEAAMAAHAIHPIVRPGAALHFEYSTSKGVPAA